MNELSIIITCHSNVDVLPSFIDSLSKYLMGNPSDVEIIIVTNEKNVNYQAGGLFIVINKMRYNLDKYVNKGDVIILNTHKYTHGVEYVKGVDVSSSNNKLNGRLSLTFSTHKT